MLINVSWASYWTVLSICLLVYYAYVGFRYFRFPFSTFVSSNEEYGSHSSSFAKEAEAYLCAIGNKQIARPELIYGLQRIALKYKDVPEGEDRNELTKLILFLCKDKCAVTLSEEELKRVWLV
jgi:hypothetical protein